MSTVALNMIVKDEFESMTKILVEAQNYFDQINLTVSDKPTANKLTKLINNPSVGTKLHVKWREWNGHFDDARNENFAMSTCDYNFWLDADDTFDFRAIPKLVEIADQGQYGAIFLPYNYAQDEEGKCIARHWRERLTSAKVPFVWKGWVHESQISEVPYTSHRVNVEVKHNSSPDHAAESLMRNHTILVEAAEATKDPRYIHYLGMSYFSLKAWKKCIETLESYLEVGGSEEDIYRSLCMVSEAYYHDNNIPAAIEYVSKAMTFKPEYPMAYWYIAQYELGQSNYKEAIEWVHVSEQKPDPQTLSVWDPTSRERAVLISAQSYFMLGEFNLALAELRKIEGSPMVEDYIDDFTEEADKETFVKLLPKVSKYFSSKKTLWESLSEDLKYDNRLKALRYSVTEPRVWEKDSVVILCGQGYEEWGPHTLDKGMGGSEEAVVYLSRALADLGYNVTVFAEAEMEDDSKTHRVTYRPWKEFDKRDKFDIFVGWRSPQFCEQVNARVKVADIHDIIPKELVKDYPDVKYMVKSKFHRDLYPDVPDDKFIIVGNGIEKGQF